MNILVFDVETTGFVEERLPLDDASQPEIVQLAAQLCDDAGKVISALSLIVDAGCVIPEKAASVHGITTEIAAQFGVSRLLALSMFSHLYQRCDLLVAHNIKFDKAVIEIAIGRQYGRLKPLAKPTFCTMESAAPIVNLPPTARMIAAGMGNKPKAPKLEEAVLFFFGETLAGAHDAMVDVEACRRIYSRVKGGP